MVSLALLISVAAPPVEAQSSNRDRVETVLKESAASERTAEQASARGNHARAAEIEEASARNSIKLLSQLGKDAKLILRVVRTVSQAEVRAAAYYEKAGNRSRAVDALERLIGLNAALGTASPYASELPKWRALIKKLRARSGSTSSRPSSPRPSSPSTPTSKPKANESPLGAVTRALVLNKLGRTSEALVLLDAALPKLDTDSRSDAAVVSMANSIAARIYRDALLPTKAEARLLRAVSALESSVGRQDKALIDPLMSLGWHYLGLDETERAAPYFMRAYDIAVAKAPKEVADCITGLARVLDDRKDHKEAIALMLKARSLLKEQTTGPTESFNYMFAGMTLARMYESIDMFAEAAALYEEVRGLLEPMYRSSPAKYGIFWANYTTAVGWHFRKRGDFVKAEGYMREALELTSKTYPKESLAVANAECNLGEVFWASGDLEKSLTPIGHCFDLREKNVARILASGAEEQKRAYMRGFLVAYEKTMTAQIRAENKSSRLNRLAMNQVLRTKGRILDAVTGESMSIRRNATAETRTLLDRLATVRTTVAGLSTSGQDTARIQQLEEESRSLESQLSEKSAGYKRATKEVSIATVRAAIPRGAALIEIVAFRPLDPLYRTMSDQEQQHYIAYVLHGDGSAEPVAIDLGLSAPIDEQALALRAAISNPQADPIARASRLYERVLAPLEPHLRGKTHLIVSPDGALNTIPFAAMRKNDAYLVSQYTFTYVTSGRDLLRWGTSSGSESAGMVVLANPEFAMNGQTPSSSASPFARVKFAPLAGTETEATAIKALFSRATVLTGRDATEPRVKELHHPRVLHLATHGFFFDDSPAKANTRGLELDEVVKESTRSAENPLLRSGLAFAGASSLQGNDARRGRSAAHEDGILTALEAASLDLSGTKLVVLSACQTAQGEARNGEGVYGLRRALAMAGAETLVMSLWSVDDEATSYLMQGYYKRLKSGGGRSEALRAVQLEMASSKGVHHPYYWAAFIPSGDPGSMVLTDEAYEPHKSTKRRERDKRPPSHREPAPDRASGVGIEVGLHYMTATNLLDQVNRGGGLASLAFDTPFLSRFVGGRTFGIHDALMTSVFAGARTSDAAQYSNGEEEGAGSYGARAGYELALGLRTGDFGIFAGAQAMYNTFALGDVRTYGTTTPLLGIIDFSAFDTPISLRGTYGRLLVDQEIAGASIAFGFSEVDVRLGIEELKMPTTVSLDGAESRASAGRQVFTIGTIGLGGRL